MRVPTPEQWKPIGEALGTWGFWAIVYGAIAVCIGLAIIFIVTTMENKPVKFIK